MKTQPESTISNVHHYDILCNPNYFDDFVYIPNYSAGCEELMNERRQKFIIDNDADEGNDDWVCDKIRVGLNLAYIA